MSSPLRSLCALFALLFAPVVAAQGIDVQGTINSNTTWTTGNTYNLKGDVTVAAGVTLTIQPGVTVSAPGGDTIGAGSDTTSAELIVSGTLSAVGTGANKITFTAVGAAGSWVGIRGLAGGTVTIAHANIDKAETGAALANGGSIADTSFSNIVSAAVRVTAGTATLERLVMTGVPATSSYGVYGAGGTVNLSYSLVNGVSQGFVNQGSTTTAVHNTFVNNTIGLYQTGGAVTLRDNILANNSSYNIYRTTGTLSATYNNAWTSTGGTKSYNYSSGTGSISANPLFVSSTDFALTSNSPSRGTASDASDMGAFAYNGVASTGLSGRLATNRTLSGANTLTGDLTVPTGVTLTLSAGATLTAAVSDGLAAGSDTLLVELIVQGTLVVQGTATSKVTLTGAGTSPGSWVGIRGLAGSTVTIAHATVDKAETGAALANGGSIADTSFTNVSSAAVHVTAGTATLDRLVMSGVAQAAYGVYGQGGTVNLSYSLMKDLAQGLYNQGATTTAVHNTFVNNSIGLYQTGGAVTLRDNILANNSSYNIYRTTGTLSATYNNAWTSTGGTKSYNYSSGTGSISANPLFVSSTDFALTSNSPSRGTASDASDMGAFAYNGVASTGLSGRLATNRTLSGANTLTGDLTVPAGVTLTLSAGTTLTAAVSDGLASGSDTLLVELIVQGTLVVQGTATSKVTLTGAGTSPGSWVGIRGLTGSTVTIAHANIDKAETGAALANGGTLTDTSFTNVSAAAVHVTAGTATLDRLVMSGVAQSAYGVYGQGGTVNLSYSLMKDLAQGLYNQGATTTAVHNTFVNNSIGLYQTGGAVTLRDNILANNSSYNIYRTTGTLSATYNNAWTSAGGTKSYNYSSGTGSISANPLFVSATDFALTSNSPSRRAASDGLDQGAFAFAGALTAGLHGKLFVDTTVSGNQTVTGDLTIAPGATLTVSPGATLTFAATDDLAAGVDSTLVELKVQGTLSLQGTSSQPVKLTTAGASGSWTGVIVEAGATLLADQFVVEKANNGITLNSSATLTNGTFTDNASSGVNVKAGTATLAYLTFVGGTGAGVLSNGGATQLSWSLFRSLSAGVQVSSGSLTADHNTVVQNTYGVYLTGGTSSLTNNILVNNVSYNIYRSTGTLTATYNDVWVTGGGTRSFNYAAGTGSISANPLFVNDTTEPMSFKLQSGSPAIGTGSAGSDMGAFPFAVGAVNSIVVTPSSPSLVAGSSVTFTAQAFDSVGNPIPGVSFTWTAVSAAGSINSSTGKLTVSCAPSTGSISSAVTASASGKSGTTAVTVVTGPVATVTISPKTVNVAAGGTQQFTAVAKDSCQNVLPVTFNWVAGTNSGTVDANGLYTAPCVAGSYVGAVQVSTAGHVDSATVNVGSGQIAQLTVSPANPTIPAGGTQQFSASGTDTCGNMVQSATVTWSTSGGGSISSGGLFTAGATTGTFNNAVMATAGSVTASTSVTVSGGAVARVAVTPATATLPVGGTQTFTAQGYDAANNPAGGTVTWSVGNATAGAINGSTGVFTASSTAGTYTDVVVATIGGVQGKATVVVNPGPAATVNVLPVSTTLAPAGQTTFVAQVLDASGNQRQDTVTWSVANAAAGSITASGVFTAGSQSGSYPNAVVATVGTITGRASVTVDVAALSQIVVAPASTAVRANNSVQFSATGRDAQGNTVPVTVTWSVAQGGGTISSTGLFTAGTTPGTFVDTVRAQANGGLSATSTVIVQPGPVVAVEVTPAYPELNPGATQLFQATPKDAFGNALTGAAVTWAALPAAGEINAAGLFTAGTTPGDFASAVTATVESVSGSSSVRVLSLTDGGTGGGEGGGAGGGTAGGGGQGGGDGAVGDGQGGGDAAAGGCGCGAVGSGLLFPAMFTLMLAARRRRRSAQ